MDSISVYLKNLKLSTKDNSERFDLWSGSTPSFPKCHLALFNQNYDPRELRQTEEFESLKLKICTRSFTKNAILTPGASHGFFSLFFYLSKKITGLVIEQPYYEPYLKLCQNFEIDFKISKLKKNGILDISNLRNYSNKHNCIVLSNPNFFTGDILGAEDISELCKCFEFVIIDEVQNAMFSKVNALSCESNHSNLFKINSLTKCLGLSNIRLGWITSNSSEMSKIEESTLFTFVDMPTHSILIGKKAIENFDMILMSIKKEFENNRNRIIDAIEKKQLLFSHSMEQGHFVALKSKAGDFSLGLSSEVFGEKNWRRVRFDREIETLTQKILDE